MPALETDCREQFAVYEEATGTDDYNQATRAAPVELKVRWELTRSQIIDAAGDTISIEAQVVVNQVIVEGSTMWLGKLADYPASPANLKEVVVFKEIPDIKGREFRRTVLLRKFSDTRLTAT